MTMYKFFFILLILIYAHTGMAGRIIQVGHGEEYAYQTICAALDDATSGDLVLVADFIYSEETGERFPLHLADGITLKNPDPGISPIIQGNEKNTVIEARCTNGSIEGLTLKSGLGSITRQQELTGGAIFLKGSLILKDCHIVENKAGIGGGLYVDEDSQAILHNCVIEKNKGKNGGGGIFVGERSVIFVEDCLLIRNKATNEGGGVFAKPLSVTTFTNSSFLNNRALNGTAGIAILGKGFFQKCTIKDNVSLRYDGGVLCAGDVAFIKTHILHNVGERTGGVFSQGNGTLSFSGCIITDNIGYSTVGGVYSPDGKVEFNHCTISGNSGGTVDGVACGDKTALFRNCIIHDNDIDCRSSDISYTCIPNGYPGEGNLVHDPCFKGWGDITFIYVDQTHTGYADGSEQHPFPTIADALKMYSYALALDSPCRGKGENGIYIGTDTGSCTSGGNRTVTLRVAPGVYSLEGCGFSHRVNLDGAGIDQTTLVGTFCGLADKCSLRNITLLRSDENHPIRLPIGKNRSPYIQGCKIQNGGESITNFVGIQCAEKSAPIIENCVLLNNHYGVACAKDSKPLLLDSVISDNWIYGLLAYSGSRPELTNCKIHNNGRSGVHSEKDSLLEVRNCTFLNNRGYSGAGIYGDVQTSIVVTNSVFSENIAGGELRGLLKSQTDSLTDAENVRGGGVCCYDGRFTNCVFYKNRAGSGGGLFGVHEAYVTNSIFLENSPDQIAGNVSLSYSCVDGGTKGRGNIDSEPRFLHPDTGDFHLVRSSPCVDAGNPEPRYNDGRTPPGLGDSRNDMGVYGGKGNLLWGEHMAAPVSFGFEQGLEGWRFAEDSGQYNKGESRWGTGQIGLTARGSERCFSYIHSPEITIDSTKVFRARFKVKSSVVEPDTAQDFRLRANNPGNWRFWATDIISREGVAPALSPLSYDLFMFPEKNPNGINNRTILPDNISSPEGMIFSMDIVSFDPANDLHSWLYLDNLDIQVVTFKRTGKIAARYDFVDGTDEWKFQRKIVNYNVPLSFHESGRIGLTPNGQINCFSYWESPPLFVESGRTYIISPSSTVRRIGVLKKGDLRFFEGKSRHYIFDFFGAIWDLEA